MLFMFDTRQCVNDLRAGGVPEPQATTMTKIWMRLLQDLQMALQPEQAALRMERELSELQRQVLHLTHLLEQK